MQIRSLMKACTLVGLLAFGASCGVDDPAGANNSSNNTMCEDSCSLGDRSCLDTSVVEVCRRNALTGCFALERSTCASNESCKDGDCVDNTQTCEDSCVAPASRCTMSGQTETCADHNNDGCFEFGAAQACLQNEVCNQADGLCKVNDCVSTCTESATSCIEGLLSTCAIGPQGCLVFGAGKECAQGMACEGTECVQSSTCEDECVGTEKVCGQGGVLTCGNFDSDTCVELSEPVPCGATEECRNGACVATNTCQDRCLAGEVVCVGNQLARCEAQTDGCLAFSNPTDCPGTQSCVVTPTVTECKAPVTTGKVVLNEIFYDALGDDARAGKSPTFIELFGPPGFSIAGFKLNFINGSGGATYGSFELPAGAQLDGNGYAIVGMTTPDNFLALAVSTNKYFILTPYTSGQDALQNGPDSVQLLNASAAVIDAVGYGVFSGALVFAGEGQPAPAATSGRSIGRKNGVDTDDNAVDFKTYYPTPGMPNSDLIINEIYFDQPGTDTGSETFVEIVAPIQGWEDLPLDGYVLHAINGLDGMDYIFSGVLNGIDFSGYKLNDGANDGFVVTCNVDHVSATLLNVCTVLYEGTDYQNGPDNFVLRYRGEVIDAVGYGSFTPANGAIFVGEGQPKSFSPSSAGKSLGRWPLSDPSRINDTDNNATDFHLLTPTPGRDNPLP